MPFSLCIIIIFMTFRSVSAFEIQDNVSYIIIIVILSVWVAEYIKIFPWMCIEMYFPRQLSKSLNHSCDNSPLSLALSFSLFVEPNFPQSECNLLLLLAISFYCYTIKVSHNCGNIWKVFFSPGLFLFLSSFTLGSCALSPPFQCAALAVAYKQLSYTS